MPAFIAFKSPSHCCLTAWTMSHLKQDWTVHRDLLFNAELIVFLAVFHFNSPYLLSSAQYMLLVACCICHIRHHILKICYIAPECHSGMFQMCLYQCLCKSAAAMLAVHYSMSVCCSLAILSACSQSSQSLL